MNVAALFRVGREVLIKKWRQSSFVPKTSLDEELEESGLNFADWWAERQSRPVLAMEIDPGAVSRLQAAFPEIAQRTIEGAQSALAHRFDLLGSGPFSPRDPDRPARRSGYQPIDWYLDPVRELRFPRGILVKDWNLFEMRPENADIKYPWELSRCQHLPILGQAWQLTREPRYAVEILDQIEDFMEANPVGVGVNWTCTMDVGIRAANLAAGLALIKDCDQIPQKRFASAYGALFEHGRFIFSHFENTYEVTSNHFLSNVVGLQVVAAEFVKTPSGRKWEDFCLQSLETEIGVQILPDGADFESSVPYHRLVAELFLGAYRLAELRGKPLSESYRNRLVDMGAYLEGVLRPDGLMPQFGDADDGRLYILTDSAVWNRQDGRHLLAAAGAVLGKPEWIGLSGPEGAWEAAWWGYPDISPEAGSPPDHVTLYPDAGAFIARNGGNYLLVTNAIVGTEGFGNHKHNDQLSFELHVAGRPVIVDPGSYVYTSDFDARNLFRSTAYHSTLMVDGVEQNEVNPEWLFRMFEKAEAEHLEHGSEGDKAFYAGRHSGYQRLESPLMHTRRFEFDLAMGSLAIEDTLEGQGSHDLSWHFHLAPGANISIAAPGRAILTLDDGIEVAFDFPAGLEPRITDAWYSPSYGARGPAKALDLTAHLDVAGKSGFAFSFTPVIGTGGETS